MLKRLKYSFLVKGNVAIHSFGKNYICHFITKFSLFKRRVLLVFYNHAGKGSRMLAEFSRRKVSRRAQDAVVIAYALVKMPLLLLLERN